MGRTMPPTNRYAGPHGLPYSSSQAMRYASFNSCLNRSRWCSSITRPGVLTIMPQVDLAAESSPNPISITPSLSNLCRTDSTAICAVLSSSNRVSPLPNSTASLKSSLGWYTPIGSSRRCSRAVLATPTATRFQSTGSVVTTPEYRDAGRSATGGRRGLYHGGHVHEPSTQPHPPQLRPAVLAGAPGLSAARPSNTIRSITCPYQPTSAPRFAAGRTRRRSTPRIPFGARDSGHGSSRNEALRW